MFDRDPLNRACNKLCCSLLPSRYCMRSLGWSYRSQWRLGIVCDPQSTLWQSPYWGRSIQIFSPPTHPSCLLLLLQRLPTFISTCSSISLSTMTVEQQCSIQIIHLFFPPNMRESSWRHGDEGDSQCWMPFHLSRICCMCYPKGTEEWGKHVRIAMLAHVLQWASSPPTRSAYSYSLNTHALSPL